MTSIVTFTVMTNRVRWGPTTVVRFPVLLFVIRHSSFVIQRGAMHPEEFAALARVEERHWFYSGKRELVGRWLDRSGPLRRDDLLIDVGAGTGLFAAEMRRRCRVLAIDPDATALGFIRERDELAAVAATAGELPVATGAA